MKVVVEKIQNGSNLDRHVAAGFGDEWTRFDQSSLPKATREAIFSSYFKNFPWEKLPGKAVGADFGCGSGRWAALVAPRVCRLLCVDASEAALQVARRNLRHLGNCEFVLSSVADVPVPDGALDFGYSLGVLHHVPDTRAGLASCTRKLRHGAPFLLYLYYRFDNRPKWYRALWCISNLARIAISRLPFRARYWVSQVIAAGVYWPFARAAYIAEKGGMDTSHFPLAFYAHKPYYVMRTDALDRFGTRLEQRFTRAEIEALMRSAGLEGVVFNNEPPFWCAVGFRAKLD